MEISDKLTKIEGEHREKFEAFRAYLLEFNEKYNLTTITEEKEMKYKHFLDSSVTADFFSAGESVAEIGSGAGFPSVPIKIFREDLRFTLFESVGKKCDFLRFIVDKLQLKNMHICNMRSEDAARREEYREKFSYAVARAVARMNTLLEYALPLVKKGGEFFAYKSLGKEEMDEAKNACFLLGGSGIETYAYSLPEGYGERLIAAVKKEKNTPQKYPRGNGKERKQPL